MKTADFGSQLRALREEKKLGLRELASQAGISPAFLSKIESGKEKPPAERKLRALAKVLEFDPEVLMALAGRLPADIVEIIQKHPREYVTLLRALRRLSAVQLEGLIQTYGLSMYRSEIGHAQLSKVVTPAAGLAKSKGFDIAASAEVRHRSAEFTRGQAVKKH